MSAAAHPNLVQLRDVHTFIGAYHILHGVNLSVPRGQVTMLLGRDGAGKTTTLRTLMGLWRAKSGSVSFVGLPPQIDSRLEQKKCRDRSNSAFSATSIATA